jgi:transposase InsO family protein
MASSGFGGNRRIAQTLARAGWRLSRESIRRIRKEKPIIDPRPTETRPQERSLRARSENHLWMVDVTEIPSWFRIFSFKLALVLDVFSRFPLSWKIFWFEPSTGDIRALLGRAIRRYGKPRYLVSDKGPQFTALHLRSWLQAQGIHQRFGAIGKTGSIAVIERFWRTIKNLLGLPFAPPLLRSELQRRLGATLTYYAELKPHSALGGNTPADRYLQRKASDRTVLPPPRGRPGEKALPPPFRVAYFRRDAGLPYLVATTA